MRILISTAHRNLVGGVEKYLQALVPALRDRGHELGLLHEYQSTANHETIDAPEGFARTWWLAESDAGTALRSIAEWHPDMVYHHGFDRTDSMPAETALLGSYPALLYVHNYDRTCGTGQKCFMFPQPGVCERKIGPMCLVLHYPRRCGGLHPGVMWHRYRRHAALHALLPHYQAVLVASSHMQRELAWSGVDHNHLHLVPLPATGLVLESAPAARRDFTGKILFVGRLTNLKGADYLIRAIPAAQQKLGRNLTVAIAGDGPELQNLRSIADQLGTAVEFCGWVDTQEKLNLMRNVDLLAVPSLWPEPFGLVGLEAGGVGLPAVGFASGGIPDWLLAGETGELAPGDPPTVAGLSDAIVRALASTEHYSQLSLGAWNLARQFTLVRHVERLEALLAEISSGPGARSPQRGLRPESMPDKDAVPQ